VYCSLVRYGGCTVLLIVVDRHIYEVLLYYVTNISDILLYVGYTIICYRRMYDILLFITDICMIYYYILQTYV